MDLEKLIKQCQSDTHRWFPELANNIPYLVLSLNGEAGEVAEHAKKVWRGSKSADQARAAMGEEAVDVLIYLCCLFAELGIDVEQVYTQKRAKNELRFGQGPLSVLLDNHPEPAEVTVPDPVDYFRGRAA